MSNYEGVAEDRVDHNYEGVSQGENANYEGLAQERVEHDYEGVRQNSIPEYDYIRANVDARTPANDPHAVSSSYYSYVDPQHVEPTLEPS